MTNYERIQTPCPIDGLQDRLFIYNLANLYWFLGPKKKRSLGLGLFFNPNRMKSGESSRWAGPWNSPPVCCLPPVAPCSPTATSICPHTSVVLAVPPVATAFLSWWCETPSVDWRPAGDPWHEGCSKMDGFFDEQNCWMDDLGFASPVIEALICRGY